MKVESYGHINHSDKRLYIGLRKQFDEAVANMAKTDEDVIVKLTVETKRRKRTTNQNAYYFGVIVDILAGLIAESDGVKQNSEHSEQAHEILKWKCNSKQIFSIETGEIINIPQSTTKQTTVEHNDYCDRCRAWILDFFGVVVPLPNEQMELI